MDAPGVVGGLDVEHDPFTPTYNRLVRERRFGQHPAPAQPLPIFEAALVAVLHPAEPAAPPADGALVAELAEQYHPGCCDQAEPAPPAPPADVKLVWSYAEQSRPDCCAGGDPSANPAPDTPDQAPGDDSIADTRRIIRDALAKDGLSLPEQPTG